MIIQVQPAKAIVYGKENIFTKWIFYSLAILLIFTCVTWVIKKSKVIKTRSLIWGIMCLVLLIALFLLPDGNASMGFISSRLLFFFFLFLIVFLATQKIPVWLQIVTFIIINYVNIALIRVYIQASEEPKQISRNICEAAELIEPYSTVYPINESGYWLYGHLSNYLGAEKPMMITENYEASQSYFPLQWNKQKIPSLYLGIPGDAEVVFQGNKNNSQDQVEYVFVLLASGSSAKKLQDARLEYKLAHYYPKL